MLSFRVDRLLADPFGVGDLVAAFEIVPAVSGAPARGT